MVNFEWDPVRAREVTFEEGLAEGEKKMAIQVTLSLLKNNVPVRFITESTHLSVEEVEKIAKDHQLAI